jgi:hypothetical protein
VSKHKIYSNFEGIPDKSRGKNLQLLFALPAKLQRTKFPRHIVRRHAASSIGGELIGNPQIFPGSSLSYSAFGFFEEPTTLCKETCSSVELLCYIYFTSNLSVYSLPTDLTSSSSPLASNPTRPSNGTHKQHSHHPLRRRNRRHRHRRRRFHRPPRHLNHLLSKTQSRPSAPALAASPERTKRKGSNEEARRDALDAAAGYRADLKRMETCCSRGLSTLVG